MIASVSLTVSADTKEKPFICHCGAAFTRRDLLTRHQRLAFHEDGPVETPAGAVSDSIPSVSSVENHAVIAGTPDMSLMPPNVAHEDMERWPQPAAPIPHQPLQDPNMYTPNSVIAHQYQDPLLPNQFFDASMLPSQVLHALS